MVGVAVLIVAGGRGQRVSDDIPKQYMKLGGKSILRKTVDAFKTVTEGVNRIKSKNNSFLIITHYQKLLDYVVPDYIHVMKDGKIIKSGDKLIAHQIEADGYKNF